MRSFFWEFGLSKAELSLYLLTVRLQKKFDVSIKKLQNRSRKVIPEETIKVVIDYLIMRIMKALFLIRCRVSLVQLQKVMNIYLENKELITLHCDL